MQLEPGKIVDEKYEIQVPLGMGGFGVVYRARQIAFDRIVALKVLHAHLDTANDAYKRFEREAKALSLLRHRNLVIFYGFGVWQQSPYIAMEMVQGKSLQDVLNNEGALPLVKALYFMKQLCHALVCAHANGIVHRDLKPTNVMICESEGLEYLKVIDFGLAKILPGSSYEAQRLTEAGYTVGSAQYMSPEQCLGQPVDERSDIYSIACIMHRCLTGSAPFQGEHSVVVMQQQLHDAPPLLSDLLEEGSYPFQLQDILIKGLAKSPADRYQSVEEMLSDLEAISDDRSESLVVQAAPITGSSARHRALMTKPKVRLPSTAIFFGVLFLIAIGCSAMLVIHMMSATPSQQLSTAYYEQAASLDDEQGYNVSVHPQLLQLFLKALELNRQDKLLSVDAELRARCQASKFLNEQRRFLEAKDIAQDGIDMSMQAGIYGDRASSLSRSYAVALNALGFARQGIHRLENLVLHCPNQSGEPCMNIKCALCTLYLSKHEPKKALSLIQNVEEHLSPSDWTYVEFMYLKSQAETDLGQTAAAAVSARKSADAQRVQDKNRLRATSLN